LIDGLVEIITESDLWSYLEPKFEYSL